MNEAGSIALFISFLAVFICAPIVAYCCCCNKSRNQYRIFPSTNAYTNINTSTNGNTYEYPSMA